MAELEAPLLARRRQKRCLQERGMKRMRLRRGHRRGHGHGPGAGASFDDAASLGKRLIAD